MQKPVRYESVKIERREKQTETTYKQCRKHTFKV